MDLTQLHGAHKSVIDFVKGMFMRQSSIQVYKKCPQRALYNLLDTEPRVPWFATILGTAGHTVCFQAHETKQFDLTRKEIEDMLYDAYKKAMAAEDVKPNIGAGFSSHEEMFDDKCEEYVSMIYGYLRHPKTQRFIPQIHEQYFVLQVDNESGQDGDKEPFMFTGQIDLAGFDRMDATLSIRDQKFRDNAFKPSYHELKLSTQLTVYAWAFKYGVPACSNCRPQIDPLTYEVSYTGPCRNCEQMIGTPRWPQVFPHDVSIVWMRDFIRHDTDQYPRYVKDPNKIKTRNPVTGRMVIRNIANPKWETGYKSGDYVGEGFLTVNIDERQLRLNMADVLRVCSAMRAGLFYRAESKDCFMCDYSKQCLAGTEEHEPTMEDIAHTVNYDPFA